MNRKIALGVGVGVLILGLVAALWRTQGAPESPPVVPGASAPGTLATAPSASSPAAPSALPPAALPTTPGNVGGQPAPSLQEIKKQAEALTANGRTPSIREVDALLASLQKTQNPAINEVIDLQVVRDVLARTDEIQQISAEVQKAGGTPTPAQKARLQALVEEMKPLQARLLQQASAAQSRLASPGKP